MANERLLAGDKIKINGNVYKVVQQNAVRLGVDKLKLRAMQWSEGDAHAETIYSLNTELPPFENVTVSDSH